MHFINSLDNELLHIVVSFGANNSWLNDLLQHALEVLFVVAESDGFYFVFR